MSHSSSEELRVNSMESKEKKHRVAILIYLKISQFPHVVVESSIKDVVREPCGTKHYLIIFSLGKLTSPLEEGPLLIEPASNVHYMTTSFKISCVRFLFLF